MASDLLIVQSQKQNIIRAIGENVQKIREVFCVI